MAQRYGHCEFHRFSNTQIFQFFSSPRNENKKFELSSKLISRDSFSFSSHRCNLYVVWQFLHWKYAMQDFQFSIRSEWIVDLLFLTTTFSFVTSRRMFSSVSWRLMVFFTRLMSVMSVMSVVRSVRSLMLLIFVMSVMSSMMMVSRGVSTIFSTKSVCERSLTIFHVFVLASNIWKREI